VKAEEYEAAVNKVLEAFGLDPQEVVEVLVQPHKTTVTKRMGKDAKHGPFTARLYTEQVIERDDCWPKLPAAPADAK
jgi:hypothetical protein